ncbi:type IX secretion system membrane protein PorP/SprF, partial [Flavobacterium psychrophilum]|nr:type IX secretion system membrane protein PorP/SprF [Flavobacterium psychrophilum]
TQWVGLEGAPVTNNFTISSPVTERLGLGLSVINDRLGISSQNNIMLDVSYWIPTSDNFKLAFGVKASANFLNVDYGKLTKRHSVDVLFENKNIDNKFRPNIGAGLYWYSDKTYVGLSIPFMLETKYYDNNIQSTASQRMHFDAIAGHVFDLTEQVKFKPAALVKYVAGAPLQVDLSANFLFYDKLTLGAAYRWSAAMSALVGFQISDSFLIGYAYDKDTTRLGSFNSGSHEIFLRYEIFKKYDKIIAPRFF